MNLTELAHAVARKTGLSQEKALAAVNAIFHAEDGVIVRQLRSGRKVVVTGFGTFSTRDRPWRWGRNPLDGSDIRIPPARQAKFKFSNTSRDTIKAGAAQVADPEVKVTRPSRPAPKAATAATDPDLVEEPTVDNGNGGDTPDPSEVSEEPRTPGRRERRSRQRAE